MGTPTPTKEVLADRLRERYKLDPKRGCWLFTGGRVGTFKQYGKFRMWKKMTTAHRAAYLLFVGDIPEGMDVCHTCDVGVCINPSHLFLGTKFDNMQDCVRKGRLNSPRGERRSRLTNKQVIEIRNASGPQTKIARKYKIAQTTVSAIQRRVNWRHI